MQPLYFTVVEFKPATIASRTSLASFDTPIAEVAVQELIDIWRVNPPGTNLQTLLRQFQYLCGQNGN